MQPLLALLAAQTEFLVVHRAGPVDVVALVVGLATVPPLLLFATEIAAGWMGFRRVVHVAMIGLLAVAIAFLSFARIAKLPGAATLGCAVGSGVLAAAAYVHSAEVRRFARLLGFAPLVFALTFVLDESVRKPRPRPKGTTGEGRTGVDRASGRRRRVRRASHLA